MEKQLLSLPAIKGKVKMPSAKSYAQRAIALAALNTSETLLKAITFSNDVEAAIAICISLGAQIERDKSDVWIRQPIQLSAAQKRTIRCGESGLSTRLFSAFSLLTNQPFRVEGEGSLLHRNMDMVREGLEQFGKKISTKNNQLPFVIEGNTQTGKIEVSGEKSSQFITGLLLVTPFLSESTELAVSRLKSKPYISMTLAIARDFGLQIDRPDECHFLIKGKQSIHKKISYSIEGDWSAASIYCVAGAIGGAIELEGLNPNSLQADRKIEEVICEIGAEIEWKNEKLLVKKKTLNPFQFDATDCPDLFPALVVLAAYCPGISTIKGAKRLINKESSRGEILQKECAKVGVKIFLHDDEMTICGGINITKEIVFDAHNDHRIAMAMSLFAVDSPFPISIRQAEAVQKSYPQFFDDFSACAVSID